MSKQIPLTQGKFAIVDDADFDNLNKYKWQALRVKTKWYVVRGAKRIRMHHEIIGYRDGMEIDHIDGNGLNNLRENLRFCTRAQNAYNQAKHRDNTSGYKGVVWNRHANKWMVHITANGKRMHIGLFTCKEDAALAYNKAALKYHGEFARLNEIYD